MAKKSKWGSYIGAPRALDGAGLNTSGKEEMNEIGRSLSLIHISEPTRPY